MIKLLFSAVLFTVSVCPFVGQESESCQNLSIIGTSAKLAELMGQAYQDLWNSELQAKIDQDIEKYRKGDPFIEIIDKEGYPVIDAYVIAQQQTHEFLFGSNLFVLGQLETPELNLKYETAFANLFNFATIPFYWKELEPQQGKPRFGEGSEPIWRRPPPDQLVNWCKAHNITPKGHALMYNRNVFMPDWTERNDPELFLKQSKIHIEKSANRYKNDLAVWDVVNEERYRTRNPDTGHKVPDDYLVWCFRVADSLFPENVKLLYNDDTKNHDCPSEYVGYVNSVIDSGLRIDRMGIQFHLFNLDSRDKSIKGSLYPPDQLINTYDQLAKTGLPLHITEITVPGSGENGSILQANIVENLYRLWFSIPNMEAITWWNLADGTAHEHENNIQAGLLDNKMDPKPAYLVLDKLINQEWKTNMTIKTNTKGRASFRGFFGKYRIIVNYNGKKYEKEIELTKSSDNKYIIQL